MKNSSLQSFGVSVAKVSLGKIVMDLSTSKAAREELRLYLALCAIGHMRWNLNAWVRDQLAGEYKIELDRNTVSRWVSRDPVCSALKKAMDGGGGDMSEVVREWHCKARVQVKKWQKDDS